MQTTIPQYNTILFTDVTCGNDDTKKWNNANDFLNDWKASGIYSSGLVTDNNIKLLYYLLYARYGNNPIANRDVNQFRYKIWSIIFQYAPTWEKELAIQTELRALSLQSGDLFLGSKIVYNHAYNPSTTPNTLTVEDLTYIDDQNTTNYKKSKLEGLALLDELLRADVSENLINRFRGCFKQFVLPEKPILFEED